MKVHKYAAVGGIAVLGSLALTVPVGAETITTTRAPLQALNNSGVMGTAQVAVHGRHAHVSYSARGLLRGAPHAAHIHFGAQARHECPTVRDDSNADHRISTAEGQPAYGPIRVSLTTRGDTSPASALAVTRFPTAPNGTVHYDRHVVTDRATADAIARGDAVVVVHGLDYNQNGKYDFRGAGKSELDPALPAEATDPAACAALKVLHP